MNLRSSTVLVICSLALGACCGGKQESAAPDAPATKAETHKPETKPTPPTPAAHPVTPPPAAAAGAMGPDGLPVEIPTGHSKVPTLAEWDAVTREINVARSTPLGCETKMVREWLRVSCRGKNDKGGEPLTVETKSSGGLEAYVLAKNKLTSLVVPVARGKHYEAVFGWTDKTQLLVMDWPNGAPRPSIKFTDP